MRSLLFGAVIKSAGCYGFDLEADGGWEGKRASVTGSRKSTPLAE